MVESIQDPRRPDPPTVADEREMLTAWIEFHRTTLLLTCEGLSAEDLRARPVGTSLMSLHGLVRHMAEVERNWFQRVLLGQRRSEAPLIYYDPVTNPEGGFQIPDGTTLDDDVAIWRRECERSRSITAEHDLEATGERGGETISLRWILVHMIEEYARHNGHADLIREMIDGSVGD